MSPGVDGQDDASSDPTPSLTHQSLNQRRQDRTTPDSPSMSHLEGGGTTTPHSPKPCTTTTTSTTTTTPPYWEASNVRQRSTSHVSADSMPVGAITLQDNEDNDRNDACWAKSVEVVDYTVVNGSTTNLGAFVVWIIRVEMLTGSYMNIRKRYSEFDQLRVNLIQSFPNYKAAVPPLPPKSIISRFGAKFLEKRRAGLQYFLNCILLNPEFSGSPVLKDFLFN